MNNHVLEKFIDFCDAYRCDEDNTVYVGEFYLNDDIAMEESVGHYQCECPLYVHIFTNDDGNNPHVHITDTANPKEADDIDFCVRLDTNKTFEHGNSSRKYKRYGKNRTYMNRRMKEAFNKFMMSTHKDTVMSNWEYAVMKWNNKYRGRAVTATEMPDYTHIDD